MEMNRKELLSLFQNFMDEVEAKERKAQETVEEVPEPTFKERAGGFVAKAWESITKSKHLDIFKTLLISIILAFLSYKMPYIFFDVFGKDNIPGEFAEKITSHSYAAYGFFIARFIVDLALYVNENIFYIFMKRNGNNAFDYQETFTELTKWQQSLLATIKYLGGFFGYILLLL